jgi:hypothetical protein
MTEQDPTADQRAALVPEMPAELAARVAAGERVWTTAEMTKEFEVLGFAYGFAVVRRRSDGVVGSLMFTHSPRFYFGWKED